MSNEPIELKGAVARSIEQDPRTGRYELHVVIPNPLAPGQFIERTVTLWHSKPGDTNPDVSTIEQTQAALRRSLGDNNITFSYPLNTTDPNNVQSWLAAHPNAHVTELYQKGRYMQLGNASQSSQFGDSKYLKLWEPKSNVAFDPNVNFVRLFDVLPMPLQRAISSGNFRGDGFRTSRSGNVYLTIDNEVVDHVAFATANAYESNSKDMSCRDIAADIVRTIQQMATTPEAKNIGQEIINIVQQGQPYGLSTLVKIVGGMNAPRLKNDSVLNGAVKSILQTASRATLQMYVRNLDTGLIHRVSSFKFRGEIQRNDIGLEFALADYQPVDVDEFLLNGLGIAPSEIINIAKENGLTKDDQGQEVPNRDTVNDALKLFNAILENREVTINTMVAKANGPRDVTMLPAYVNGFGAKLDEATINAKIAQNRQQERMQQAATQATQTVQQAPTNTPFGAPNTASAKPVNNATDKNLDPFAGAASANAASTTGQPQAPAPSSSPDPFTKAPTQAPAQPTTPAAPNPSNDPFATPAANQAPKAPAQSNDPFAKTATQPADEPAPAAAPNNDPFANAAAAQTPSTPAASNDPFAKPATGTQGTTDTNPFANVEQTSQPNPFAPKG